LKKKKDIHLRGLILLLIYIISNSPAVLFHHHDNKIVTFNKATACEKTIYYSVFKGKCEHKAHLTKSIKKCSLCENHTLTPHFSEFSFCNFFKLSFHRSYSIATFDYKFANTSIVSNRGPPTI
jgi:hypothetical protein